MIADIKFYLSILWRRSPLILAILLPVMIITYFYAKQLPAVYAATARLLVEAPSIPDELTALRSRDDSRERMEVIQQRLLTRANLLDIAEENNVVPADANMSPDEIVDLMMSSTMIGVVSGRDLATIMTIRFNGPSPVLVTDIVNDYVTRILREDTSLRQGQARQTEEFFQQEVDRLSDELDIKSAAISSFRAENVGALPETFTFRLDRLAGIEERLATYTQEILLLREQRSQLADTVIEEDPEAENAQLSLRREELLRLRRELAEAVESGGETSPRIRILRSRISQVEQVITSLGGTADGQLTFNDQNANQLAQIDTQISFLDSQISQLQTEAEGIQETLERTPIISIALADLERDYENTLAQYNSAVERPAVAETTERIELLSRGERVTVLEPPTVPDRPFKPNRRMVMAAGTLLGLLLSVGLVLGYEFLNPLVKRPSTLVKKLGITPIATIPYIRSQREIWSDRIMRGSLVGAVVIGVPAVFWALHTYYLPLDLLAERVLERFGV